MPNEMRQFSWGRWAGRRATGAEFGRELASLFVKSRRHSAPKRTIVLPTETKFSLIWFFRFSLDRGGFYCFFLNSTRTVYLWFLWFQCDIIYSLAAWVCQNRSQRRAVLRTIQVIEPPASGRWSLSSLAEEGKALRQQMPPQSKMRGEKSSFS